MINLPGLAAAYLYTYVEIHAHVILAQEEHIYIMDAAAVSSICSGTFYDKKVLTKVFLVIILLLQLTIQYVPCFYI